jgi:hypothetical protein
MDQAKGFDDGSGRVYRLYKSIYGTRQGAHDWHMTIKEYLLGIGFKPFRSDPCLYLL